MLARSFAEPAVITLALVRRKPHLAVVIHEVLLPLLVRAFLGRLTVLNPRHLDRRVFLNPPVARHEVFVVFLNSRHHHGRVEHLGYLAHAVEFHHVGHRYTIASL